ncbi:cobalt-precorrin-5B (C(1))-methyltransferase [Nitrososphaera sp.]|uniref:cobalt-precorrin-5B (C(1))-methyltransferase n=1 Tax=Nitrososphaera sp. TaxID=1971748 RepID=UPI00307F4EF5
MTTPAADVRGNNDDDNDDDDIELAEQEQELPAEIEEKKRKGALRTGYTTGTTATAATRGALLALLGRPAEKVTVTLPKGRTATIAIAWTKVEESTGRATCAAIKDGGDDPDVTHGAEICSTVSFNDSGTIRIDGGRGVGRVTKPGLGLEIGRAAINSTPMWMICKTVEELAADLSGRGVDVVISVPKGEELAKKTDNPRLGIMGGISILGTTGIVLPYSTASFAAAIRQSLDVAIAMGADTAVLTTGGRSEDFARALFPALPDHCFVQMGDFAGYSVRQCADKKMRRAIIAGFIGKLTKMAMGIKQTHVRGSHVSMEFMAGLAEQCGAPKEVIEEIRKANTARHAGEIVARHGVAGFFDLLCKKVFDQMHEHAKGQLDLQVVMFEFDGRVLASYPPLSGSSDQKREKEKEPARG